MVAKIDGGLHLESVGGDIAFGQNEKLTAQGAVELVATTGTVQIGDVSATELRVDSPTLNVLAREPGPVLLKSGGTVTDQGTDLVANSVDFSSVATIVGTGTVRVATSNGAAANAGPLEQVSLPVEVRTGDMVRKATVLDLTIVPVDLPNETPQRGPVVSGLVPLRMGDQAASGSARPPGAEETLAYLRCTAERRDACAVVPGSPLDSPRGAELSANAARFLGDSAEAREQRDALARLEPGALRELAVFLTEVRLLGLSEQEYQAVRDALYREILADRGPAAPDARAFAAAVEGQARGVPL